MTKLPDHGDARRIAAFLESHPGWSAFWDKQDGVWRVAEDDPTSQLYAESADAGPVAVNTIHAILAASARPDPAGTIDMTPEP